MRLLGRGYPSSRYDHPRKMHFSIGEIKEIARAIKSTSFKNVSFSSRLFSLTGNFAEMTQVDWINFLEERSATTIKIADSRCTFEYSIIKQKERERQKERRKAYQLKYF